MIDMTGQAGLGIQFQDGDRVIIGPEEAKEILIGHAFVGQRPIHHGNMRAHSLDMQHGRFWSGSQIVFAQLPDGQQILVNGYHRMNAVIDCGELVEFQVLVERVKDHDGVRALYCSIDTNLRKRTDGEIVRAAGIADELNVRHYVMTAALGAVTFIASGLRAEKLADQPAEVVTAFGRKEYVADWADEIRTYADIVANVTTQTLRRRLMTHSVMAVALVTLRYQPERAHLFWTTVAADDGLRKGDPRKTLIETLVGGGHRGSPRIGLIYAAKAWNAWCEGKNLHILRAGDASVCDPIGTPYATPKKRKKQSEQSDYADHADD